MVAPDGRWAPWDEEQARALIAAERDQRGPLLPILHALQAAFGYIDAAAVPLVAEALNLSRAEVYGVVTFYGDFRSEPPGASVVRVCRAEACQSMGGRHLADYARRRLGVDFGGTTTDGMVTLEAVYCLGNSALSPAVMVDGQLVGRVDEERFETLVAAAGRSGSR